MISGPFDSPDLREPYELKHGAIVYPYLWGGPSGSSVPGGFTGRIWVCSEQLGRVSFITVAKSGSH